MPDFPFHVEYGVLKEDYHSHSHDFNELFIVTKGNAIHKINKNVYTVSAGDVFVIKSPLVEHAFTDVNQLELFNIIYNNDFLEGIGTDVMQMEGYHALFVLESNFLGKPGYRNFVRLKYNDLLSINTLCQSILEEYNHQSPGYKSLIKAYFTNLIIHLLRFSEGAGSELSSVKLKGMGKLLSYIESNFKEYININELAEMSCLSERQFLRVFKLYLNTTPGLYINNLRIRHAAYLLKNTNKTVKIIALESGYNDANYFSRSFKTNMKLSPEKFRSVQKNING